VKWVKEGRLSLLSSLYPGSSNFQFSTSSPLYFVITPTVPHKWLYTIEGISGSHPYGIALTKMVLTSATGVMCQDIGHRSWIFLMD